MGDIRILIAGPDAETRARIKTHATFEGLIADEAGDGIAVLKLFRRNEYHIIIIDANITELDAWNVCRQIRKSSNTPVIIISDSDDEEEKLSFFELGADDFVVKPFSGKVMMARIHVILRHSLGSGKYEPRRLIFDGLCIDSVSRTVYIDGEIVELTPKEYKLLLFFARNPHVALSRERILRSVWGEDFFGTDRTVDTHVKMLREHIKPYGRLIDTVWGLGYIFK
ncbi:MAG: response regulator transcription factor [Burkholderiales bacterium]